MFKSEVRKLIDAAMASTAGMANSGENGEDGEGISLSFDPADVVLAILGMKEPPKSGKFTITLNRLPSADEFCALKELLIKSGVPDDLDGENADSLSLMTDKEIRAKVDAPAFQQMITSAMAPEGISIAHLKSIYRVAKMNQGKFVLTMACVGVCVVCTVIAAIAIARALEKRNSLGCGEGEPGIDGADHDLDYIDAVPYFAIDNVGTEDIDTPAYATVDIDALCA
jgi:hypothetical protein